MYNGWMDKQIRLIDIIDKYKSVLHVVLWAEHSVYKGIQCNRGKTWSSSGHRQPKSEKQQLHLKQKGLKTCTHTHTQSYIINLEVLVPCTVYLLLRYHVTMYHVTKSNKSVTRIQSFLQADCNQCNLCGNFQFLSFRSPLINPKGQGNRGETSV